MEQNVNLTFQKKEGQGIGLDRFLEDYMHTGKLPVHRSNFTQHANRMVGL